MSSNNLTTDLTILSIRKTYLYFLIFLKIKKRFRLLEVALKLIDIRASSLTGFKSRVLDRVRFVRFLYFSSKKEQAAYLASQVDRGR